MEFPLEILRRRWYDKDPYVWLLFNGLRYAEIRVLENRRIFASFASIDKTE